MVKLWEGKPRGQGTRFGIVVSRFNSTVTDRLLDGAIEALTRCSVESDAIEVVRVPGAFEIPVAAKMMASSGRVAAIVCLGAIIKGGTPHWDFLSRAVTEGIARAALDANVPMTNAVLTTETMEQAVERARKGNANKGYDAAMAAVEMADLARALER